MAKLGFVPYTDDLFEEYARFSRQSWGDGCYQAKRAYLDWLYLGNPTHKTREKSFLIATETGRDIRGVIHKMRLNWIVDGDMVDIPAVHNLYVAPQHRSGIGIYLITAMVSGERHVFCPGQLPPLTDAYRALKWQKVKVNWYRKVLRPVATGLQLAQLRLFPRGAVEGLGVGDVLTGAQEFGHRLMATATPGDDLVAHVARRMRARLAHCRVKPHWSEGTVRWRFFHPSGPGHILFYRVDDQGPSDFLIVSIGVRHGFRTARILEASPSTPRNLASLVRATERFLAHGGMHVLLSYSADADVIRAFDAAGWKEYTRHRNETFFYHRDKSASFSSCAFGGAAGDFGFEAIP